MMDARIGRLRLQVLWHGLRFSEIRWIGKSTNPHHMGRQWVISPVQVAYWPRPEKNDWQPYFSFAPIRRWPSESVTS